MVSNLGAEEPLYFERLDRKRACSSRRLTALNSIELLQGNFLLGAREWLFRLRGSDCDSWSLCSVVAQQEGTSRHVGVVPPGQHRRTAHSSLGAMGAM